MTLFKNYVKPFYKKYIASTAIAVYAITSFAVADGNVDSINTFSNNSLPILNNKSKYNIGKNNSFSLDSILDYPEFYNPKFRIENYVKRYKKLLDESIFLFNAQIADHYFSENEQKELYYNYLDIAVKLKDTICDYVEQYKFSEFSNIGIPKEINNLYNLLRSNIDGVSNKLEGELEENGLYVKVDEVISWRELVSYCSPIIMIILGVFSSLHLSKYINLKENYENLKKKCSK